MEKSLSGEFVPNVRSVFLRPKRDMMIDQMGITAHILGQSLLECARFYTQTVMGVVQSNTSFVSKG